MISGICTVNLQGARGLVLYLQMGNRKGIQILCILRFQQFYYKPWLCRGTMAKACLQQLSGVCPLSNSSTGAPFPCKNNRNSVKLFKATPAWWCLQLTPSPNNLNYVDCCSMNKFVEQIQFVGQLSNKFFDRIMICW